MQIYISSNQKIAINTLLYHQDAIHSAFYDYNYTYYKYAYCHTPCADGIP